MAPAAQTSGAPARVVIGKASDGQVIHAKFVFLGLFGVCGLVFLGTMLLFRVSLLKVLLWMVLAAPLGLGYSYLIATNRVDKVERRTVVRLHSSSLL